MKIREKNCVNILVRGVNWIGDAVMTMPALRALKHSHPEARITLLVKPWVSQLFEKDPNIDEIILYTDLYQGLAGKFKLAAEIRKHGFCMAALFQNAFDAAFIAFLAGIPERIGYNRDCRRLLLTKAIPFDDRARDLHHIEYYLNLIRKAGFPAKYELPWIYLSAEERLDARNKLKALRRPIVGINPGATYGSSKRWPPARFAEVAFRVVSEMHGSVVIFGGPSEAVIAEEIEREFNRLSGNPELDSSLITHHSLLNMAGRTSLRELISLISECELLVTNDSGPMHISYAVRTPVVAIFGSTSPEHTGPAGKKDIAIKKALDCAPCFERECKKNNLECMEKITSGEVFDAVKERSNVKKAVFFDRDGTLCKDTGYLSRMEDFEVFPDIGFLTRLKQRGFSLIGITNQSGISRGLVDEDFARKINSIFLDTYGFDGFYYCPHHPDEHCSCRKPEPGLLLEARADYNIDLKKSFVVGDKNIDMLLARSAGATGILVRTGQDSVSPYADYTVANLGEAVDLIIRKDRTGQ
ncbi:MAG: lipopolysaccharide heptosyltransferase II [Nitrospira bacterium HGW-Nitrospira-1]|nr:MAG: lipopolysaccharide heptosyltransferase II [Nitrospira bacterium HGW-Nitrospira-1]